MPIAIGFKLLSFFGLSDKLAKRFAPLGLALIAVAAVGLLVGGFMLWLHFHDRGVIEDHEQEREVRAGKARETAADERLADAIENAKSEQELHDAIDNAPEGGELSPAAHTLACERLRRIGRIPPACRSAGGNGSEAAPD